MVLLVLPAFLPFASFSTPNKGGRVPPGPFLDLSLSSATAHVTLSYKKKTYCTFSLQNPTKTTKTGVVFVLGLTAVNKLIKLIIST